jgi:hypothetical protein
MISMRCWSNARGQFDANGSSPMRRVRAPLCERIADPVKNQSRHEHHFAV